MPRNSRGQYRMAENMNVSAAEQQYTGRQIVLFKDRDDESETETFRRMRSVLSNYAGIHDVMSTRDVSLESYRADKSEDAEALVLENLGIAIVSHDGELARSLSTSSRDGDSEIEAIIPEKIDYLMQDPVGELALEAGESDAEMALQLNPAGLKRLYEVLKVLTKLCDALAPAEEQQRQLETAACYTNTATATWGLYATRVLESRYSGRGVRVAVLDTGIDLNHRDFVGRSVVARSFVPGIPVQDVSGHGTHCIGTACGSRHPASGRRYGIAYNSEIYALKVFNNDINPGARRGDVLAAMDFASRAGCRVISMSLGRDSNGQVDEEYERAICRVRRAGSLVVAAAGNAGQLLTGSPANSPSATAVAAVDNCLRRAHFSSYGKIEIAGPGVEVISSLPGGGTGQYSGTSMATPHVAGIAALWLEAVPAMNADQLEHRLQRTARRLPQPATYVGAGLVQAPV